MISLVQSARLNGHEPWAYLRDVLQRLPTQLNNRIDELLPHCWKPISTTSGTPHERMKHIEALIDDGGEITLGAIDSVACAATACDAHNALAMLVRRDGEPLNALLRRLDRAIAKYNADGEITDEINLP